MPLIDPEDYPTTPRGYRHPPDDVGGVNVANDVPGDVTRLAEDIDADVTAHEADTTNVHGIADTSLLVVTSDARLTDTRTPTDGTVTLTKIAAGGLAPTAITGTAVVDSDPRLSDPRTPNAHAASHAVGGSDSITLAQSQVTGLAADLAARLPLNLIDAKGDLIVGTANDIAARLPVGTAGQLLVPDTSASGGLAWKSLTDADVAQRSRVGNLLTANQASGGETLANTTGLNMWNGTFAYDAGRGAIVGTKTVAGPGALRIIGADRPQVTPGRTYTVWVDAEVLTLDQYISCSALWEDEAGTAIGASGAVLPQTSSGRTAGYFVGVAPAGAARLSIYLYAYGVGTFAWHGAGVWEGVGGVSGPPGVPITGQQPRDSVRVVSTTQNWTPAQPVHVVDQTATVALPLSATVPGAIATIINDGPGVVIISRTSAPDTIAGSLTSTTIPGRGTLRLAAHGPTNTWRVLEGQYSTDTVGLATYQWRAVGTPGWRLMAYDSGVRNISGLATLAGTATLAEWSVQRGLDTLLMRLRWADTQSNPFRVPLGVLPVGFRPVATIYRAVPYDVANGAVVRHVYLTTNGDVQYGGATQSGDFVATLLLPIAKTLPPSLPGDEITAPV